MSKKYVLFLCTGNSCRSQMAEGLINHLMGGTWKAFSAGTEPSGYVHPMAIRAMTEIGIDISSYRSKSLNKFYDFEFDRVITVCDHAAEHCPVFPGPAKRLHWPFDDPAKATGDEDAILDQFRRVRDQISKKVADFRRDLTG